MIPDSPDVVFLYIVGATVALVIWSVAVYVVEIRRSGSTPWSEWYNDRVVPLYRARRSTSREARAVDGKATAGEKVERKAA